MIKIDVQIKNEGAALGILLGLSRFGRRRILRAMGMRFREITQSNFGTSGQDRPTRWPPYARDYPQYGKKKGDPATLIRTGRLRSSIYVDSSHDDYVVVGEITPYGARHQFGGYPVPARPYFPVEFRGMQDRLTPYAESELQRVACIELQRMLDGK